MSEYQSAFDIRLRLVIEGFECAPDAITEIIGLIPDNVWLEGDRVRATSGIRAKTNGWRISSPALALDVSLGSQFDALIALVAPYIERFSRLPEGSRVQVRVFVFGFETMPELGLPPKAVKFMAEINADYDVDVYDLTHAKDD